MDTNREIAKHVQNPSENNSSDFKGYNLEQLRYQRAVIALRKEFCKAKVMHEFTKIRERSIFGGERKGSKITKIGGLTTKLLSGLNYLDYAMIGMSLFGTGKKIYKFFKK